MTERTVAVAGMACGGCEDAVETALRDLPGVTSVAADHEADEVVVTAEGPLDDDQVAAAVDEAGYELA